MILVTGATGTIGREVVRRLPADLGVRIMAREPARVVGAPAQAEIVYGDYGDPQSLVRAMSGVRALFLVTNRVGEDDAHVIQTARSAGVHHVVKLSAAAVADPGAEDLITRWQRVNEDLLRGSGLGWTLLRPRSFMSNALSWTESVRTDHVVRALYGSSANACVDPRDVAEVAVRALTEDGHTGGIHTLTGPAAITAVEQTAEIAALLGRPIRFEELTCEQTRAALRRRYPEPVVEALLQSAQRQRDGAKAGVENTVLELTGRPATSFGTWARGHVAAFASG
ncbi:NAD(P)H-binding protein [Streptomyces sp. NPDC006430]|uniref:NAD(P)H-binding protein n=1 Tax=Streptomyces sp. NPDC006430 TaxID=3154299 RepID=UPI0033A7477F